VIAAVERRPLAQEDSGTVDRENPWPGLAAFREEDRDFFHGRAAAVEELHRRVCRERLTVLYGLSGLGKSSLLGAGLFPRLRRNGFLPVLVRLDYSEGAAEPVDQVREALLREAAESGVEMPSWRSGDSLWEYLHRPALELWSSRNRLVTPVLVFDQFEEIFTLGRSRPDFAGPRRRFLDELGDLVEGRPPARVRERLESEPEEASEYDFHRHPYKVLLALREDFLADLEELRARMPSLAHNRMRLQRMTGEDALTVVLGAGGHLVEPDVAERIVRFVAAARTTDDRELSRLTVEPALLSVVCRELNLRRRQRGEERITSGLLEGDRDEILTDFYERGVAGLAREGRRFLEERLLTASGYRDSIAVEDALQADGLDREALDRLVAARLLRREERGGVPRVELTHDVLTGVVQASRDRRREREARESAEEARREAEERERVAAAKLRRSLVVIVVLTASLVLVVVAGIWAVAAEKNARQAQVNTSYEAASRLASSETGSKAKSLAFLASVLRLDPGHRPALHLAHDLLVRSSWALPVRVFPHDEGLAEADQSDDGRVVVTLTRSGAVRIWDTESGGQRGATLRHQARIVDASVSLDGRRLVTADTAGEAKLWNTADGTAYGETMRHERGILKVDFLRDGRWLVTISRDGTARIWDAETGLPVGAPMEHGDGLLWLSLGRRTDRILTGSTDGMVKVWEAATGSQAFAPPIRHDGAVVWDVDLSEDGDRILTITDQGPYLWDASTGERRSAFTGLPYWVSRGELSPDGRKVAFANPEGVGFLWDLDRDARYGSFQTHGADVTSLRFSRDGETLLSVSADDTAHLWDVRTSESIGEPLWHGGKVSSAAFVHGEPFTAVTASADGTARVWNLRSARGGEMSIQRDHGAAYSVLSPDGRYVVVRSSRGDGQVVRVYETVSGDPLGPAIPLPDRPDSIQLGPGGENVLVVVGGEVRLADATDGSVIGEPLTHDDGAIYTLRLSGGGDRVATLSRGGSVRIWEVESGRRIGQLPSGVSKVLAADLDSRGERLAIGYDDGTLGVVDVPSFEPSVRQPVKHDLPISQVRFLSDRHLLGSTPDGELWIDDLETGQRTSGRMSHDGWVLDAGLSQDESRVVTASFDGTVRVWSLADGSQVGETIKFGTWVAAARINADGTSVLTLDLGTGRVQHWSTETGKPLGLPSGAGVTDVRFLDDGSGWITAGWGKGGTIRWISPDVSGADPARLADLAEAISGFSVDSDGVVRPVLDAVARFRELRERAEREELPFVGWFLADPWERPLTPDGEVTVDEYIRRRLASVEAARSELPAADWADFAAGVRGDLALTFPGHPLLAEP
jgi:WD40 repeat protein